MTDTAQKGVSVVIPARDEEQTIGHVVTSVRAALEGGGFSPLQIIVVDDGSRDSTGDIARAQDATVLTEESSLGYGAALKRGVRAAQHEVVVILDGDGTYPTERVPELVTRVAEGADQVIGARTSDDAKVPLVRRPAKHVVTRIAGWLTGRRIADLNSGLRVFRRSLVLPILQLMPNGFSFSTTLTVAGLLGSWEVEWVPIAYHRRVGTSKFRAVRDTAVLLLCLIRAVVYFSPLRVFLPIAIALGTAALTFGIWDVFVEVNLTDKTVLFSLSAIEVFMLGLLADLIVKRR